MTAPLDLDTLAQLVEPPDETAGAATRDRLAGLGRPAGGLGRLDDLVVWLAAAQGATPPRDPSRARVVVFAGDHGVAAAGVSAYPPGATAAMLARITAGAATVNAVARTADATVRLVDVSVDAAPQGAASAGATPVGAAVPLVHAVAGGAAPAGERVRHGSGRIDREDALTLAEAERAFAVGVAVADEEVDGGADLLVLGDLGVAGTTVAAVLIGTLTDTEPVKVVGRGSGIDDRTWMRKVTAIRDALRRTRPFAGDPTALLAVGGGADVAAMTGFLVQAAVRRTPVLLDGVLTAAAALVAAAIAPGAPAWWLATHRSAEPAHRIALDHLDLVPVLDLGYRTGEGAGALTVLPLLRAAVRACTDTTPLAPPAPANAGLDGPADADPADAAGLDGPAGADPAGADPAEPTADDDDAMTADPTGRSAAGDDLESVADHPTAAEVDRG